MDNETKPLTITDLRSRLRIPDRQAVLDDIDAILSEVGPTGINPTYLKALQVRADLNFRLINKVLPDVKSVEHNLGEMSDPVKFLFSRFRPDAPAEEAPPSAQGGRPG